MDAIKLLGSLLGNKSLSSGMGGKILSGVLGGGGQQQQSGGGLGGLLGSVLGGGGNSGGGNDMLGSILGSVLGGGSGRQSAPAPVQQSGSNVLGDLLGSVLGGNKAPEVEPQQRAQAQLQAEVIVKAMINAAKSDGRIDEAEKKKIIGGLGSEVTEAEVNFVQREFNAPLNVQQFASEVPRGMEAQVYMLSLTSIDLDSQNEAQYLGSLARELQLDPQLCNQIHDQVGAPKIFNA